MPEPTTSSRGWSSRRRWELGERRSGAARALRLIVVSLLFVSPRPAGGHPLAPALLDVRESALGDALVTWKTSVLRIPGSRVEPVLPAHCRPLTAPTATEEGSGITIRWQVSCGEEGLVGQRLGVEGLETAKIDALVRVALADGRRIRASAILTGRARTRCFSS